MSHLMSHVNARITVLMTRAKNEDRGGGPIPEAIQVLGYALLAVGLVAAVNAVGNNFIGRIVGIAP